MEIPDCRPMQHLKLINKYFDPNFLGIKESTNKKMNLDYTNKPNYIHKYIPWSFGLLEGSIA